MAVASSQPAPDDPPNDREAPPGGPAPVLLERHRRARRMAEQSWSEFLRDLALRTLIVLIGIALVVVLLIVLIR